jgi:anaerobic magnesium-protoporphyrin IX monomethyl ester cyclase
MMAVSQGRYLRVRSVDHVLGEVEELQAGNPDLGHIYLEVETIAAMPRYAEDLCAALAALNARRERPLEFGCNLAITSALVRKTDRMERLLAGLAAANMTWLNIGLESGSERIRSEVLRRPKYSNDDLATFCLAARRHGIRVNLNVIIGLPTETVADYLETVDVARRCRPASIQHNIFYPYAGTDLYVTAQEMGLFDAGSLGTAAERRRPYLDLPDFPTWRVQAESVLIYARVFGGRWPLGKVAVQTAWQGLRPYPRLTSAIKSAGSRSQRLRAVMDRHRDLPVAAG